MTRIDAIRVYNKFAKRDTNLRIFTNVSAFVKIRKIRVSFLQICYTPRNSYFIDFQ
jgi:hypothetical protein